MRMNLEKVAKAEPSRHILFLTTSFTFFCHLLLVCLVLILLIMLDFLEYADFFWRNYFTELSPPWEPIQISCWLILLFLIVNFAILIFILIIKGCCRLTKLRAKFAQIGKVRRSFDSYVNVCLFDSYVDVCLFDSYFDVCLFEAIQLLLLFILSINMLVSHFCIITTLQTVFIILGGGRLRSSLQRVTITFIVSLISNRGRCQRQFQNWCRLFLSLNSVGSGWEISYCWNCSCSVLFLFAILVLRRPHFSFTCNLLHLLNHRLVCQLRNFTSV